MKRSIKVYEEQGLKYNFDSDELSALINKRKHFLVRDDKKVTKGNVMEELASLTFVSTEAIKNWMYGYNGPSDLEQVKKISEFFKVDYHQLLKKESVEMENNLVSFNDNTAQAVYSKNKIREIYVAIVEFIDDVEAGFFDLADESLEMQNNLSIEEFMDLVRKTRSNLNISLWSIKNLIRDSMLDIPEAFYEKLDNYCWSTLDNLITATTEYIDPEGDGHPEFIDVLEDYVEYFDNREYLKELRNLFKDYIVK